MNWLTNLFWDIRFKIEDAIYDWKNKADVTEWDRENSAELDQAEGIAGAWQDEEVEAKPKKKKSKKKSVKKVKKSV
jgi:hypothetical protein